MANQINTIVKAIQSALDQKAGLGDRKLGEVIGDAAGDGLPLDQVQTIMGKIESGRELSSQAKREIAAALRVGSKMREAYRAGADLSSEGNRSANGYVIGLYIATKMAQGFDLENASKLASAEYSTRTADQAAMVRFTSLVNQLDEHVSQKMPKSAMDKEERASVEEALATLRQVAADAGK